MTSEGQVYVWTKRLFRADNWTLLAGDPPRGTDIPRLEIKEPGGIQSLTKNKNSVVNDLVYCKDGFLLLIECKDSSRKTGIDIEKLNKITKSQDWRESLIAAMRDRSLFGKEGVPSVGAVRDGSCLVPVLSYPGDPLPDLDQFIQITFRQGESDVRIGDAVSPAIRESLERL